MPYVFISYSMKDREFVDRLSSDLRSAGVQIWRDVDNLQPGTQWASAIGEAVSQSVALLFVSSRHSTQSEWMVRELTLAVRNSILVFPIVIDDVGAERMPPLLASIQWLDFRGDYERMLHQLITVLPESVRQKRSIEPVTPKSKGYVFISYAEEDTAFVMKLREFLKDRGYGYWDYQESDRDYHSQLFLELEGVIREASATLSVLSPNWKLSKWTPKEYLFSEEVGTPVFLLMAREMGPTLVTAGIPYIDFTKDEQGGFDKLDRELRRKGLI
jgi:hypothetical protein